MINNIILYSSPAYPNLLPMVAFVRLPSSPLSSIPPQSSHHDHIISIQAHFLPPIVLSTWLLQLNRKQMRKEARTYACTRDSSRTSHSVARRYALCFAGEAHAGYEGARRYERSCFASDADFSADWTKGIGDAKVYGEAKIRKRTAFEGKAVLCIEFGGSIIGEAGLNTDLIGLSSHGSVQSMDRVLSVIDFMKRVRLLSCVY